MVSRYMYILCIRFSYVAPVSLSLDSEVLVTMFYIYIYIYIYIATESDLY